MNTHVAGIGNMMIMPVREYVIRYARGKSGTRKAVLLDVLTGITEWHDEMSRLRNKPAQGVFVIDCHNI